MRGFGRKGTQTPFQFTQIGRVVGLNEVIRELNLAPRQSDRPHLDDGGGAACLGRDRLLHLVYRWRFAGLFLSIGLLVLSHRLLGRFALDDVLQVDPAIALHDDTSKEVAQRSLAYADSQWLCWLHSQVETANGQRLPGQQVISQPQTRFRSHRLGTVCRGVVKHRRQCAFRRMRLVRLLFDGSRQSGAHAQIAQLHIALHSQLRPFGMCQVLELALEAAISSHKINIELVPEIRLKSMQWQSLGQQLTAG